MPEPVGLPWALAARACAEEELRGSGGTDSTAPQSAGQSSAEQSP